MADVTFYSQAGADAKFALKAGQLDRGAVESIVSETPPRLHEHDVSEINGTLPAEQVNLAGYAKMSDIPDVSTFVDDTELNNKGFVTSSDLSTYATRAFVTDEIAGAQLGGEGVSDKSVAAVVPTGATAQAIASLVGVVVRSTDAEATALAGQWGVAGLVIDEVVGGAVGPPADVTAPTITAPAWPSLTVGAAISPLVLSADEPVEWSRSGALPAGLSFNASTGALSGTPSAAGSGVGVFAATDGAGNAASVEWSWTVAAAPVEWAPVMSEAFSSLNESAADLTGRVADNALGGTLAVTPTIGTYTGANALLALRTSTTAGTYGTGQPFGVGLSPEVVGGVGTDALLTWAGFVAGDRALDFKATSGYNASTLRMDAGYRVYLYYNPVTRARIGALVYRSGVMLEVTNGATNATATTRPYATNQTIELRGVVEGGDLTVTLTVRKTDGTVNGTPVSLTTPAAGLVDAPAVAVHYPDAAGQGYGSLDNLIIYRNGSAA